jgi:hypothetical protein
VKFAAKPAPGSPDDDNRALQSFAAAPPHGTLPIRTTQVIHSNGGECNREMQQLLIVNISSPNIPPRTSGDDLTHLPEFLPLGRDSYSAADVLRQLLPAK